MSNNTNLILEVKNLQKHFPIAKSFFGKDIAFLKAVDNVSFKLDKGKTIGVVGESGCGKTTLGRTILQLYSTTGGKSIYHGYQVTEFCPSYYLKGIEQIKSLKVQYEALKDQLTACTGEICYQLDSNITLEKLDSLYYHYVNLAATSTSDTEKANAEKTVHALESMKEVLETASSITGGLILSDLKVTLPVLKQKITICKELKKLKDKEVKLNKLIQNEKTDSEKYNELKVELTSVLENISNIKHEVENLSVKLTELLNEFKELPLFKELENNFDGGLDLARLTKTELRSLRTEIQLIFQDPYSSLPPRMTIGEILCEPVKVHNIVPKDQVYEHVHKVMKMCGLQPQYFDRYPHEFSGGQRQRICIARALVVNPKLVICDEPVSALDVSIQAQIINLLKQLQNELGLTYMFISHDLSVVKYITDSIMVMYLGNVMEHGDTDDIFENPLHPYTKALFSAVPVPDPDAKMNRIILKGDIPSPANPPKGCKFHTRCDKCVSACKVLAPKFIEHSPNHFVACHLYDSEVMDNLSIYDKLLENEEK